jgi:hypothetical protein
VPSATFPQRVVAPATWRRELTSWVLPASPCPMTARLRKFSVVNAFIFGKISFYLIFKLQTLNPDLRLSDLNLSILKNLNRNLETKILWISGKVKFILTKLEIARRIWL